MLPHHPLLAGVLLLPDHISVVLTASSLHAGVNYHLLFAQRDTLATRNGGLMGMMVECVDNAYCHVAPTVFNAFYFSFIG